MSLVILSSCNALKYVPEDEKLFTGSDVHLDIQGSHAGKNNLNESLIKALYPKPNSKFLSMRIGLWAHYKVKLNKAGMYARFINKKFGEEPVYLSDLNTEQTIKILENRAENRGFFFPEIDFKIHEHEKTASVTYQVMVRSAYRLATYTYRRDSLKVDSLILESMSESDLHVNSRFNLDDFKEERRRIDQYVKDKGYYGFNSDYLIFTSDTNQYKDRKYDLYLDLKEQVPFEDQIPYKIGRVYVHSNHQADVVDSGRTDSIYHDSLYFIQNDIIFKPELLRDYIIVEPGYYYNKGYSQKTVMNLSRLGIYQFANIRYEKQDSLATDSLGYLDAHIYLTPGPKYGFRAGMQGVTKSSGFAGPGLTVGIQDRNLFKGGEILEITGTFGYEFQISRGSSTGLNNLEFRLENSLTFPRLLAPLIKIDPKRAYSIPNTKIGLNFNLQKRALYYNLNNILTSFGYNWNTSKYVYWDFTPIGINFMRVTNKTDEFQEILDNNQFLKRSFDNQFIPAMSIGFRYSELGFTDKKNEFFLRLGLEQASFLVDLITPPSGTDEPNTLFGQPYAQYLRTDIDLRHSFKIDKDRKIVSRFFAGRGYPYGNSQSLPYLKQYFSGGPNSVRAFQVRSLGPGNYRPIQQDDQTFFDQSGDIRLEFNLEYRFPMISYLKGAVFTDLGNIWLYNDNPDIPGGQFTPEWYKQLAMGLGYGFRVDASVLVLRLDVAHPVRYTYQRSGSNWENTIAWNKIIWNFAIGYPF